MTARRVFSVWYRSVAADGSVWCEGRNPEEVREMSPGRALQKLVTWQVSDGWEPWDGTIEEGKS